MKSNETVQNEIQRFSKERAEKANEKSTIESQYNELQAKFHELQAKGLFLLV